MPIVNYVREHMRFMEYACDEKLTSSERLLWYALMHVMNQRAQGNVWPDEFVRISNDRLLSLCPMKFDTMASARNALKQRGLIEVEKGEKNKKSPAYRMIYFYPTYVSPTTERDGEGFYPENSDNMGGNMGGNTGGNTGGNAGDNPGGNTGDIGINNNREPVQRTKQVSDEDDKTNTTMVRARARVRQAWINAYGREPNPTILNVLMQRGVVACGFDPGVVCCAIRMAALRNADSPIDYIMELFLDWKRRRITTEAQLDDYLNGNEEGEP